MNLWPTDNIWDWFRPSWSKIVEKVSRNDSIIDIHVDFRFLGKEIHVPIEEKSIWRCDMHPAWSNDFNYFAINGRINGGKRQVFIGKIGTNLSRLFTINTYQMLD